MSEAADAARGRLDWKDALALEPADPGKGYTDSAVLLASEWAHGVRLVGPAATDPRWQRARSRRSRRPPSPSVWAR